jgi:hypothetical protein
MAWIKSEQALASHPKLHMLAEDLGVSVPQTVSMVVGIRLLSRWLPNKVQRVYTHRRSMGGRQR